VVFINEINTEQADFFIQNVYHLRNNVGNYCSEQYKNTLQLSFYKYKVTNNF